MRVGGSSLLCYITWTRTRRPSPWNIHTVLRLSIEDLYAQIADLIPGSRGPAVLDDFTASYGYRFFDNAGYEFKSSPYTCASPTHPFPHVPTIDICEQYLEKAGWQVEKLREVMTYNHTALEGPCNNQAHKYMSPDSLYN